MSAERDTGVEGWGALFRGAHGLYTTLVIIGVAVHALQILVIAIIMPTVVADLGGADYYTWPAMLYTIGAIVGAASVGPVWAKVGRRGGLILGGFIFIAGSVGCALAPDMATLNVARTIQGFSGGLINGGAMEMVSGLFTPARRKRVLALTQGVWMTAQLSGPIVGGAFAEIGWWRGSFWVMLPIVAPLMILAWYRIPPAHGRAAEGRASQRVPILRLAMLSAGVFCIGLAGPLHDTGLRILLIVGAIALVGLTLRFDKAANNRLYPSGLLSMTSPVGPALWIFFLVGMVQTTVMLFVPLLLQVVHGVTPLYVSFVSIVISFGWTAATFMVSGHSGRREDRALAAGPILMVFGLGCMTLATAYPALWPLTFAALILGAGVGLHHVLLVARTMGHAVAGEERITAAALPSVRAIGTAFGAALAGMLSIMAGLGDATDPAAVGPAIVVVYGINLVPVLLAVALMIWLVRPARA